MQSPIHHEDGASMFQSSKSVDLGHGNKSNASEDVLRAIFEEIDGYCTGNFEDEFDQPVNVELLQSILDPRPVQRQHETSISDTAQNALMGVHLPFSSAPPFQKEERRSSLEMAQILLEGNDAVAHHSMSSGPSLANQTPVHLPPTLSIPVDDLPPTKSEHGVFHQIPDVDPTSEFEPHYSNTDASTTPGTKRKTLFGAVTVPSLVDDDDDDDNYMAFASGFNFDESVRKNSFDLADVGQMGQELGGVEAAGPEPLPGAEALPAAPEEPWQRPPHLRHRPPPPPLHKLARSAGTSPRSEAASLAARRRLRQHTDEPALGLGAGRRPLTTGAAWPQAHDRRASRDPRSRNPIQAGSLSSAAALEELDDIQMLLRTGSASGASWAAAPDGAAGGGGGATAITPPPLEDWEGDGGPPGPPTAVSPSDGMGGGSQSSPSEGGFACPAPRPEAGGGGRGSPPPPARGALGGRARGGGGGGRGGRGARGRGGGGGGAGAARGAARGGRGGRGGRGRGRSAQASPAASPSAMNPLMLMMMPNPMMMMQQQLLMMQTMLAASTKANQDGGGGGGSGGGGGGGEAGQLARRRRSVHSIAPSPGAPATTILAANQEGAGGGGGGGGGGAAEALPGAGAGAGAKARSPPAPLLRPAVSEAQLRRELEVAVADQEAAGTVTAAQAALLRLALVHWGRRPGPAARGALEQLQVALQARADGAPGPLQECLAAAAAAAAAAAGAGVGAAAAAGATPHPGGGGGLRPPGLALTPVAAALGGLALQSPGGAGVWGAVPSPRAPAGAVPSPRAAAQGGRGGGGRGGRGGRGRGGGRAPSPKTFRAAVAEGGKKAIRKSAKVITDDSGETKKPNVTANSSTQESGSPDMMMGSSSTAVETTMAS